MCNVECVLFGARQLSKEDVRGRKVIEVGSCDVNGSLRSLITSWGPESYIGVDIAEGPGVDVVCPAENLVTRFGEGSFDVVISTEMLEHVRDWRATIHNMKGICKAPGTILLTTRSKGFPYHAHPHDFWRFQAEDMKQIFSDCEIAALEMERGGRGVYVKAFKPSTFSEADLSRLEVYSMIANRRVLDISSKDYRNAFYLGQITIYRIQEMRQVVHRFFSRVYRRVFG